MLNGHGDYITILKDQLVERTRRNSQYSLRAFARDIDIEATQLSAVLSGKKGLSLKSAVQICKFLGFSKSESTRFCDLVESRHARSQVARSEAIQRIRDLHAPSPARSLSVDAFRVVSDWYHFAILQLIKLPDFDANPKWIASSLQISAIQAKDALERLERLELIEERDGVLEVTDTHVASPDGISSDAIKKFHEQILQKAAAALYTQNLDDRDFSAELMPIAKADIPKARAKIRKFRSELVKELTASNAVDQVYCLSVQFFNLTNTKQEPL